MGTRIAATTVALLVLVAGLSSSTANATNITYNVNQLIGPGGSVTGTITTNGATGTLNSSDILSWNLLVSDGTQSFDIQTGTGNSCPALGCTDTTSSGLFFTTSDLSATANQLLFNFNDSGSGANKFFFIWEQNVATSTFSQASLCFQGPAQSIPCDGTTATSGEFITLSGKHFSPGGYFTTNSSNFTGTAAVIASVGPTVAVGTSASGLNIKYSYMFTGLSGTGNVFIPILSPSGLVSLPGGATLITNSATILADWPGAGNTVPSTKDLFDDPAALLEIPENGLQTLSVSFLDSNPPLDGPILEDGTLLDPSVPGTAGTTSVPEPASLTLLGTALLGLGAIRRRRKRA